jgi:hypothetical protein
MRTFVYEPTGTFNGPDATFDPGVPRPDVNISLSFGDFARFTSLTPGPDAGALPPTLNNNPFIGPDPTDPAGDDTPGVQLGHNGLTSEGSWLLDTGAAASFVSTEVAAGVGVTYDPANPLGSDNPRLLGVPIEDQFTLQISGISGNILNVPGFFADNLLVRTDEGVTADDADPNHLNWKRAPVLVFDIEIFDPIAQETIVLDGIFGMNHLVATANIIPDDIFPLLLDPTEAPVDFSIFSQPAGKLGLVFDADDVRPAGDANGDGLVNLSDFLALRANFGTGTDYAQGDFNLDGRVNLSDFLILRRNFGEGTGPLDAWAATIPEPGSLALLGLGLLVRRRTHRA